MNIRIREAVEDAHRRCQSHDGSIGCAALHQAIRSLARVVVEEAISKFTALGETQDGHQRTASWHELQDAADELRALLGEEAERG